MKITATPMTAALAGILSAVVWPLAWSRFGGSGSSFSIELVVATLLFVALPAHAFVVGFGYRHGSSGRTLDTSLLTRVLAWLLAAIATVALVALYRA